MNRLRELIKEVGTSNFVKDPWRELDAKQELNLRLLNAREEIADLMDALRLHVDLTDKNHVINFYNMRKAFEALDKKLGEKL